MSKVKKNQITLDSLRFNPSFSNAREPQSLPSPKLTLNSCCQELDVIEEEEIGQRDYQLPTPTPHINSKNSNNVQTIPYTNTNPNFYINQPKSTPTFILNYQLKPNPRSSSPVPPYPSPTHHSKPLISALPNRDQPQPYFYSNPNTPKQDGANSKELMRGTSYSNMMPHGVDTGRDVSISNRSLFYEESYGVEEGGVYDRNENEEGFFSTAVTTNPKQQTQFSKNLNKSPKKSQSHENQPTQAIPSHGQGQSKPVSMVQPSDEGWYEFQPELPETSGARKKFYSTKLAEPEPITEMESQNQGEGDDKPKEKEKEKQGENVQNKDEVKDQYQQDFDQYLIQQQQVNQVQKEKAKKPHKKNRSKTSIARSQSQQPQPQPQPQIKTMYQNSTLSLNPTKISNSYQNKTIQDEKKNKQLINLNYHVNIRERVATQPIGKDAGDRKFSYGSGLKKLSISPNHVINPTPQGLNKSSIYNKNNYTLTSSNKKISRSLSLNLTQAQRQKILRQRQQKKQKQKLRQKYQQQIKNLRQKYSKIYLQRFNIKQNTISTISKKSLSKHLSKSPLAISLNKNSSSLSCVQGQSQVHTPSQQIQQGEGKSNIRYGEIYRNGHIDRSLYLLKIKNKSASNNKSKKKKSKSRSKNDIKVDVRVGALHKNRGDTGAQNSNVGNLQYDQSQFGNGKGNAHTIPNLNMNMNINLNIKTKQSPSLNTHNTNVTRISINPKTIIKLQNINQMRQEVKNVYGRKGSVSEVAARGGRVDKGVGMAGAKLSSGGKSPSGFSPSKKATSPVRPKNSTGIQVTSSRKQLTSKSNHDYQIQYNQLVNICIKQQQIKLSSSESPQKPTSTCPEKLLLNSITTGHNMPKLPKISSQTMLRESNSQRNMKPYIHINKQIEREMQIETLDRKSSERKMLREISKERERLLLDKGYFGSNKKLNRSIQRQL